MSAQEPGPGEGEQPTAAEQEELQRRLEQQLREIRVQDLLLESVASILNLSARRIAKADERDLEQGRIGIEAVRAVVDLLEPAPQEQVREALAQVQMLYARESRGEGTEAPGGGEGGDPGSGGPQPAPPQQPRQPPGEPPPRLWTPPGAS